MIKVSLTQKELEYLRYIMAWGFQIDPNLTAGEFKKELKIVNSISEKIGARK